MDFTTEIEIDAPADVAWAVLVEAQDWPRWTASIDSLELLDGALEMGRRARISQPKMSTMDWTVTGYDIGRSFAWESKAAGVVTTGTHEVRPRDDGRCTMVLGLSQRGLLAPLIGVLMGNRTRSYVRLEASGLKAAAEARHRAVTG